MRVLIVDHYYPAFVERVYQADPSLEARSYVDQRGRIDAELFGETAFEVAALQKLGEDAFDSLANVRPLQAAWAAEHGVRLSAVNQWGFRLRRGFFPWPKRSNRRWVAEALRLQVKVLRPDVLHVQAVDMLGGELIRELRGQVRLIVGQIAAPLSDDRVLANYDLVVSSLPNFVDRFRSSGLDSEWLPLAFEPSLVTTIGHHDRDVPVSFVGSLSSHHRARVALLESMVASADLSVWTGDADIAADSALKSHVVGPAWGRGMYEVLARSRVTVNSHIDVANGYANNLRLYEATGMGALLLTEQATNLGRLFDVGTEVVAYDSDTDCVEKVRFFVGHPSEAAAIAAAGQRRTLKDHTWLDRMSRLLEMWKRRL